MKPHRVDRAMIAILLALAAPVWAQSAALTVEQLMGNLARKSEAATTFVETRYSDALKTPLVVTGELRFRRPGYLERDVSAPRAERYVVDGDRVTIERPGEPRPYTLSLAAQPLLQAFIASIRATLGGDLEALRRYYRVEVAGTAARWTLTLLPSDPDIAELVRYVRISGSGTQLAEMEVVEASGDRTVTRFGAVGS